MNRKYKILFSLLFSFSMSQDRGLIHYEKGNFNKARDYYERLQKRSPSDDKINYSLGTASYQQNDVTTASQLWNLTKNSKNNDIASKAYYNLGNMFTENKDLESGLNMYKKAMELDPQDSDIKINYELTKRMIQEQEEQNQKEQNQKEQNQEEQNQKEQNQEMRLQAEAILNALKENQKINQKLKISKTKVKKMVKDW